MENPGEKFVPGWKWRHESPSPEPEDLTPLNTMDMEFTPSEVDALEAIPAPTPPPERIYYPPGDPRREPGSGLFAGPLIDLPTPSNSIDGLEAPGPKQPPILRQRRRQRRDENPAQSPRRSARIAAKKANLPLPPAERSTLPPIPAHPSADKPKKGHPRKANPSPPPMQERRSTARPIPARPPTDKPKRGRPRKVDGSAVSKAPARLRRGATTGQKRPRGRPRKDTVYT